MSEGGTGVKRPLDHEEEGKDGGESRSTDEKSSSPPPSIPAPSRNPWWNPLGLMKRSASTQAKGMRIISWEWYRCNGRGGLLWFSSENDSFHQTKNIG